jgi:hypothetical protein
VAGDRTPDYDLRPEGARVIAREIGMKGGRYFALAVATLLAPALPASAVETRAVVELFTSQGCSSCPPADKLLADLSKDPTLIPLSLAIDYWDYLGWKDTLALPGHANRQKAYSHMRGDRDVYTPQAVVNGSIQVLGSDRAAIERAIAQSRHNAAMSLPLTLSITNGQLTVTVPDAKGKMPTGDLVASSRNPKDDGPSYRSISDPKDDAKGETPSAEVWLCPVVKSVEVSIGRGENSGHTFTYHNVVRRWVKLGVWTGKAESWSIPIASFKDSGVNAVAVIVQNGAAGTPGAMLGATMASLDETTVSVAPAKR